MTWDSTTQEAPEILFLLEAEFSSILGVYNTMAN